MLRLVVLGLLLLQDPDVGSLVQQLGDNDPARREEAVRKIRQIGPGAREALEKALKDSDPEVRTRVQGLLDVLERERLQALLESRERKRAFPRVTLDMVDVPRCDVLAELSRQSGWELDPQPSLSLNHKVTVQGRDIPMIQALHQARFRWSFSYLVKAVIGDGEPISEATVFDDGLSFSFSRRLWAPAGKPIGTIFETKPSSEFEGDFSWKIASVKTDREWPIETCAIHSPSRVYVGNPDLIDPRVTVKGTRLWFCPTPLEFPEPKSGDLRECGPCQLTIEWPKIRVRLGTPVREFLRMHILTPRDIQLKLRPGREKETMGVGVGGGGGGRYGGRFGGKNLAWCGCADHPATEASNPFPMTQEFSVEVDFGDRYAISDVAAITVTFHKPVEDSFELSSPPLK